MIVKGRAYFTLDGKEHVVQEGENFVIPRGVVHTVSSRKNDSTAFKVRGDRDPVAERDFLMEMFGLVETVSAHKHRSMVNRSRPIFLVLEPVRALEEIRLLV